MAWLSAIAASAAVAAPAAADETSDCIAAHVEAQRLQRDRKIRDARRALVDCSRPACPKIVLEECTTMLANVEQAIPTVVFEAHDAFGRDVADARVSSGPRLLSERLDGKAVEVDPGEHVFRFERAGVDPVETRVVMREGDKGRRVAVTFGAPRERAAPEQGARPIPPLVWVAGGVGLAGLTLFGAFGAAGLSARSDLDDRGCKPNCPSDDVDGVRRSFVIADVSLVIGLAAFAAAPIIYFATPAPARRRGGEVGFGVAWTRASAGVRAGARW